MSTVRTNNILDASGGNTATINSMTPTADSLQGFRNRLINGEMVIDQRNAGAAVTATGYPVDRFFGEDGSDAVFTLQQDSSAPTGFTKSVKATITTADASIGATQYGIFAQYIEGTNVADLGFGSASAKTVTLSFWVRSSLTGTFGGVLTNSGFNRSYPFTYTISAADTWEQKSVIIAGDTTGTWLTTTGVGFRVIWSLGSGSTYSATAGSWTSTSTILGATGQTQVISTLNATWYITGAQLEVGSVATPFERRDYGRELMLCQRYYYRTALLTAGVIAVSAFAGSTTDFSGFGSFPVRLRTNPSALEQSGTASHYAWNGPSSITCSAVPSFSTRTTTDMWQVNCFVSSGLTTGYGGSLVTGGGAGYLGWSAEL
jgi:hypothetical protein